MGPSESGGPVDLRSLNLDALRRAASVYLDHSYPSGDLPEVVRRRLEWPEGVPTDQLLNGLPFEKVGKDRSGGSPIYALRLGNAQYPHMKLQIQPWPNDAGFLLSVNTHDQILGLDPGAADLPAFRAVQSENQRIKEAIEEAWDREGLPTFLRYLREYIEKRSATDQGTSAPPPA